MRNVCSLCTVFVTNLYICVAVVVVVSLGGVADFAAPADAVAEFAAGVAGLRVLTHFSLRRSQLETVVL